MTAALLAVLAALAFAGATVLQHRAAAAPGAPAAGRSLVRLALHLLARPVWLLGTAAGAAGLALQALALRAGQVVVVQPLLTLGLPLSLAAGALLDRRRPPAAQWRAALGVALGLALFLLSAQPRAGTPLGSPRVLLAGAAASVLGTGVAVLRARRLRGPARALVLGLAAGAGFGVTGVLLKQVVTAGPAHLLTGWPLWALLAAGAPAVAAAQGAFQSGALAAGLPAMTLMEPAVAVALGSLAFGEELAHGPGARAGQVLGLLLTTVAVVRLARLEAAADPVAAVVGADHAGEPRAAATG